jgi:hypothetical protein
LSGKRQTLGTGGTACSIRGIRCWYCLSFSPYWTGSNTRRRGEHVVTRLPKPHEFVLERAATFRRIAIALTALEARYLPKLDPEWLQLVNTNETEWRQYRDNFDPVAMCERLGYPAAQARQDAEWLLLRAHHIDPVGNAWSRLMRRAPRKAWKDLKDAVLLAMDYREAAELLLLFYEDLADRSEAEPLRARFSVTISAQVIGR